MTKKKIATIVKKAPRGRPRVSVDVAKVESLASMGVSQTKIAAVLGISRSTLIGKKKQNEAISAAIIRGRAQGVVAVANALQESAIGGNVQAQMFFLKNRAPEEWNDTHKVEAELSSGANPLAWTVQVVDTTSSS